MASQPSTSNENQEKLCCFSIESDLSDSLILRYVRQSAARLMFNRVSALLPSRFFKIFLVAAVCNQKNKFTPRVLSYDIYPRRTAYQLLILSNIGYSSVMRVVDTRY